VHGASTSLVGLGFAALTKYLSLKWHFSHSISFPIPAPLQQLVPYHHLAFIPLFLLETSATKSINMVRSLGSLGLTKGKLKKRRVKEKLILNLVDFERSSYQVLLEWHRARELHRDIEKDAQEAEKRLSKAPALRSPTYHDVLAELQLIEFDPFYKLRSQSSRGDGALIIQRRKAIRYAACERIGSAYFDQVLPTQNTLFPASQPSYSALILPSIPIRNDVPYYLYDSWNGKVCKVQDLISTGGCVPDYVAISHSWIRWQDDTAQKLQLPGVPWQVPQNTRFKVEDLPAIVSALPWRYIWIDLLTIPQGSSPDLDEELLQRKDLQIRHVSSIFRKASKALAWFDDIPAWTVLPAALRYLTLQYFTSSVRTGMNDVAMADNPLELLSIKHGPTRQTPATNVWEPNAWFTSPWALQELILRPDMLLYNSNWEVLEISKGNPITMNDIAVLLSVVMETRKTNAPAPLSVQELYQLFENVGLTHILEITKNTSVNLLKQINGISPQVDKGYPCIVPQGDTNGSGNPHELWREKCVKEYCRCDGCKGFGYN
jgi:hypothetical protein